MFIGDGGRGGVYYFNFEKWIGISMVEQKGKYIVGGGKGYERGKFRR